MSNQLTEASLEMHNPSQLGLAVLKFSTRRAAGDTDPGYDDASISVDKRELDFTVGEVWFGRHLGVAVLVAPYDSNVLFVEVAAVLVEDEWQLAPFAVSYNWDNEEDELAASLRCDLISKAKEWAESQN